MLISEKLYLHTAHLTGGTKAISTKIVIVEVVVVIELQASLL